MFYNKYRSTKAGRKEFENKKNKLSKTGKNIINQNGYILNMQKREKLKDLLLSKFTNKYQIEGKEQYLENEISKFVQRGKLSDIDLQMLDKEFKKQFLKKNKSNSYIRNSNLRSTNFEKSQPEILPKIKEVKPQKIIPEIKNIIEENNTNKINENSIRDNIINRANGIRTSKSVNITKKNQFKFLSQEEELAKLEEEVAKFEEEYPTKKSYKRIDFSEVGDEWTAMANYNKRLYDRQVKEEKAKELELKKRTKEDLDYQVKQKLQKELEEKLREEEDNKIFVEHLKHIDELEKEKRKAIKEQLIKEKLNRDAQVKDENLRKKIEQLKTRKFEMSLIKNIQSDLEKEKKEALQRKLKENEALKKIMKENELNKEKQKELLRKEKQEDYQCFKEMEKNNLKNELNRKRYFENIRKFANKYDENEVSKIIDKMKSSQKEEDEKMIQYMKDKKKEDEDFEKMEKQKKMEEKMKMKKYLDMQVEEKKKERDLEKAIDNEQARIWNLDNKKYEIDERRVRKVVMEINKKNLDNLVEQIKKKKQKKFQKMTDEEYAMNRETLEKAKIDMEQVKQES